MKRVLLALVLLLVSAPLFALPCSDCDIATLTCFNSPGSGTRCRPIDCRVFVAVCAPALPEPLAADLTIASVEVITPAKHTVKVAPDTVRVAAKLR